MLNPMEMTGKTVLVTGASSGIGRQTCRLLDALGARLVLVARSEERLAQTHALLERPGHLIMPLDLTEVEAIPAWVRKVTAEVGPLDGLVHGAGVQITRPLRLLTQSHVEETMRLNVGAAIALAKGFRQKGNCTPGSCIVLVSSVMGIVGQAAQAAYAASKGAIVTLTKSLALELARDRLRVNCVAPAIVNTEMSDRLRATMTPEQFSAIEAMHPLGLGTPDDVAYAIAFLLAPTARWITGTTLVVDGGYTAQ